MTDIEFERITDRLEEIGFLPTLHDEPQYIKRLPDGSQAQWFSIKLDNNIKSLSYKAVCKMVKQLVDEEFPELIF